jgi:gliding motility-associated protein GldM
MAGGKLSPRQKMINLMYLIFIAMLALNMSKEVLSAFGFMNETIADSNVIATQKNTLAYSDLTQKAQDQAEKYKVLNQKATSIRTQSTDLYNYIEGIKTAMFEEGTDLTDYEAMDKSNFLDLYFYQKGEISENGQLFLDNMKGYKDSVNSTLDNSYPSVTASVNQRFDTSDIPGKGSVEKAMNYLEYNYVGFPSVASLTKLTSIQAAIKSTESDVLSAILEKQLGSDAGVNASTYKAILLADKSAFFSGENFTGKLVLGRYDASLKPEQVFVNGIEIKKFEGGGAILDFPAGPVGERDVKGKFVFMQDGEPVEIPIETSYAVVPKPNSAVIAADKMNVVYRGLSNPMTVSIPGIPDNKVSASGTGLRKGSGTGKYIMTPGGGARTVKISATGTLSDGGKVSSSQTFRIKDIPKPLATVRKESGYVKMPKSSLVKTTVGVGLPDFLFDLKFNVNSFKVKAPGSATIVVNGNRMNSQAQAAINKARSGDIIAIFDVKSSIQGVSGISVKDASAISVEIQ